MYSLSFLESINCVNHLQASILLSFLLKGLSSELTLDTKLEDLDFSIMIQSALCLMSFCFRYTISLWYSLSHLMSLFSSSLHLAAYSAYLLVNPPLPPSPITDLLYFPLSISKSVSRSKILFCCISKSSFIRTSLSSLLPFLLSPPVVRFLLAIDRQRVSYFLVQLWTDLSCYSYFLSKVFCFLQYQSSFFQCSFYIQQVDCYDRNIYARDPMNWDDKMRLFIVRERENRGKGRREKDK